MREGEREREESEGRGGEESSCKEKFVFTYPLQFRHTTQFLNALTTVDSGEGRGREGRGEGEGECWGKTVRRREGWGERERVRG